MTQTPKAQKQAVAAWNTDKHKVRFRDFMFADLGEPPKSHVFAVSFSQTLANPDPHLYGGRA